MNDKLICVTTLDKIHKIYDFKNGSTVRSTRKTIWYTF